MELLDETLCRGETPFELQPSLAINKSGLRPPQATGVSALSSEIKDSKLKIYSNINKLNYCKCKKATIIYKLQYKLKFNNNYFLNQKNI